MRSDAEWPAARARLNARTSSSPSRTVVEMRRAIHIPYTWRRGTQRRLNGQTEEAQELGDHGRERRREPLFLRGLVPGPASGLFERHRNPLPRLLHPVEGPDVALFRQPVEAIPDSGDLDEVDLAFRHGLLLDHSTGCSFVLHGVPWFPRPATPILP